MDNKQLAIMKQVALLKKQTFLDPTYDTVFKKIFSKDATLIHFLNAILHLEGDSKITSIEQRKPSVKIASKIGYEEVRFDIHAKTAEGKYIDIEMQRAEHEDFIDRIELYASQLAINSKIDLNNSMTTEQLLYHPYLMPTTYSIWICNFDVEFCNIFHEEFGVFRFSDMGKKDAAPIFPKKKYIVIDLTKFKHEECGNLESQWLEVFKYMASAKKAPPTADEILADVYSRMKVTSMSNNAITEVASGMVTEAEINTRLGTARREGIAEGIEKGKKQTVLGMSKEGLSIEVIARVTGFSQKEIKEILG